MMLEEAPREFMLKVEDKQRVVRADLVDEVEAYEAEAGPGEDDTIQAPVAPATWAAGARRPAGRSSRFPSDARQRVSGRTSR